MRKVRVSIFTGYPTAIRKGSIEVDDDATNEEIDEMAQEWANERIEVSWDEIKSATQGTKKGE